MFNSISKLYRIQGAADLLLLPHSTKRIKSIPSFQPQLSINYANTSFKYCTSQSSHEKITTEILNFTEKCVSLKIGSNLKDLNSKNAPLEESCDTSNKASEIPQLKSTAVRKFARHIENQVPIDLIKYRNGNVEHPGLTVPALVKNYFIEKNVATVTITDLFQYFEEFGFYATKNEQDAIRWKNCVYNALCSNPRCYRNEKHGHWTYIKFALLKSCNNELKSTEQKETREYAVKIYKPKIDFTWNGNTFELCGHKFCSYLYTKGKKYALCRKCVSLKNFVKRRNAVNKRYTIPKIGVLKVREDGSVEGCPWKPGQHEHFCLQADKLREDIHNVRKPVYLEKQIQQKEERISELYNESEEEYALLAADINFNNVEPQLQSLLNKLDTVYPYSSSQKLAFLYFRKNVDNPTKIYYGVTCDVYGRFYSHSKDKNQNIQMIIVPLGKRNKLFVKEIEAIFIAFSNKALLIDGNSCENDGNGIFSTKKEVFKDIVDQDLHPSRPNLIESLNQLIEYTKKYGQVITTSSQTPKSLLIRDTKRQQKRLKERLKHFDTLDKKVVEKTVLNTVSLTTPITVDITEQKFNEFLDKLESIHKYTEDQVPAYLYFLKYPNDLSVKRYDITTDPQKRLKEHKRDYGKDIEMIIVPLGKERSILFVEEIEALLIGLSKKKLLNDGKSILNDHFDNGYFNTKYEVHQAIVERDDHPHRPYMIKILDYLIESTFKSNNKV